MKDLIEEAFRIAILAEKKSYDLYRSAALSVSDPIVKRVLERLASEESGLIAEIVRRCPSIVSSILEPPNERQPARCFENFESTPEQMLLEVLRVALSERQSSIDSYATFVTSIKEPALCSAFELALDMSRKQHKLITEEYRRADQRLHGPGTNRRAKRAHIRPVNRPAPNKHSQLFISLLDCGRQSQL